MLQSCRWLLLLRPKGPVETCFQITLNRTSSFQGRFNSPQNAITSLRDDVMIYKKVSGDLLRKKYTEAYSFYEQFSHMDEVREAQNHVVNVQNELQAAQLLRSDRMHQLINIREKLQPLRNDLSKVSMMDGDRYLRLCEQIVEFQKQEQSLMDKFQQDEHKERNLFTHLTSAVKASHEKEKIYANTVKYWSYIGSIIGILLGIIASTVNYHYRQNSIKTMSDLYTEQVININANIDELKQQLNGLRDEVKSSQIEMLREIEASRKDNVNIQQTPRSTESWTGFFYRKTIDLYRWFVPRSRDSAAAAVVVVPYAVTNNSKNLLLATTRKQPESWSAFIYRKTVDCYRYFVPKRYPTNDA